MAFVDRDKVAGETEDLGQRWRERKGSVDERWAGCRAGKGDGWERICMFGRIGA